MKRPYKRRNFFIKKDLQGRYIFSHFMFVLVGSLFFALAFSLLSADTMTMIYDNYTLELGQTPVVLFKQFITSYGLLLSLGALFIVILAMFLTHRIAGPIYRFEKTIDAMLAGDLSASIHLRCKDEGKEVADKLNQFNEMLADRLTEIKNLAEEQDLALQELADCQAEQTPAPEALLRSRSLNNRLRHALSAFKSGQ